MVIAIQLYHKRGGQIIGSGSFMKGFSGYNPYGQVSIWFHLPIYLKLHQLLIYVQGTIGSQTQIWLVYSMKLWGEFCEKTFMQLSESLLYLPVIEVSFFVCFNEVWKWRVDPTACHSTGPHQPLPIKDGQIIFLETHLPFYLTTNE